MMEKKKNLTSFKILERKKEIVKGNKSALKNFWLNIEKFGTPLIEPIQEDKNHKLVTFIVQADKETKNAIVICSLADQDDMVSNNGKRSIIRVIVLAGSVCIQKMRKS